jgi:DNA polymerase
MLRCERLHDIPFLFITLPSGRSISYPFVRLFRRERGSLAVSFWDNAILTGGWTEYRPGRGMWGGGFTENIVQGIARDLLAAAMTRLEAAGYPIVLHVHDAIVCEVPHGASELP